MRSLGYEAVARFPTCLQPRTRRRTGSRGSSYARRCLHRTMLSYHAATSAWHPPQTQIRIQKMGRYRAHPSTFGPSQARLLPVVPVCACPYPRIQVHLWLRRTAAETKGTYSRFRTRSSPSSPGWDPHWPFRVLAPISLRPHMEGTPPGAQLHWLSQSRVDSEPLRGIHGHVVRAARVGNRRHPPKGRAFPGSTCSCSFRNAASYCLS